MKKVNCSFESVDFADLAMGKLKSTTAGIVNIDYKYEQTSATNDIDIGVIPFGALGNGFSSGFGYPVSVAKDYSQTENQSTTGYLSIECDESAVDNVVSQLINLGANKISVN